MVINRAYDTFLIFNEDIGRKSANIWSPYSVSLLTHYNDILQDRQKTSQNLILLSRKETIFHIFSTTYDRNFK